MAKKKSVQADSAKTTLGDVLREAPKPAPTPPLEPTAPMSAAGNNIFTRDGKLYMHIQGPSKGFDTECDIEVTEKDREDGSKYFVGPDGQVPAANAVAAVLSGRPVSQEEADAIRRHEAIQAEYRRDWMTFKAFFIAELRAFETNNATVNLETLRAHRKAINTVLGRLEVAVATIAAGPKPAQLVDAHPEFLQP